MFFGGKKAEGLLKMLARSKKLDICIKHVEYRHYVFQGVCFWGKNRRLTKDAGQVFKKSENFEILKIPDRKSAGVEIDPTPRGIIFSLLGLPGGSKIQKIQKSRKFQKKTKKSPSLLSAYAGNMVNLFGE